MEWIKTSERLPENDYNVLVTKRYHGGAIGWCYFVAIAGFNPETKQFMEWNDYQEAWVDCTDDVFAWMPLPKPLKEE